MITTIKELFTGKSKKTDKPKYGDKQEYLNNPKEIIEEHDIKDTPFKAVKNNNEWFLALGRYKLTKSLKTRKEVEESAEDTSWHRLLQIIQIMIEANEERKKQEQLIEEFKTLNQQKNG